MVYHNCVYQGSVYNINQICQGHILIPKPLKSGFFDLAVEQPQLFRKLHKNENNKKQVSIINIVSNIYRNIKKFLPNTIKYFTR